MQWLEYYRRDFQRYASLRTGEAYLKIFLTEQGLWALLQYRIAHNVYRSSLPWLIKRPLLILLVVWQKFNEIITGICIPYAVKIGAGLYIGHFGSIILHYDSVIGENCNISQGVTIGVSGRGTRRGVPVIGDRVYIAAHAVVVGKIRVGDDALIGANSLVNRDVAPHTTVLGVPAQVVSHSGSADYLMLKPQVLVVPEEKLVTVN